MIDTAQSTIGFEDVGEGAVSLVIPCRPEYVGLCRLVAGVVGTRESLAPEEVADLKLVVTEACTCFLSPPAAESLVGRQGGSAIVARSLRVDFRVRPAAWQIIISDPDGLHHIPPAGRCDPSSEDSGLGLMIIRALVDSVEHTDTESEGSVIRLFKRMAPRTPPTD